MAGTFPCVDGGISARPTGRQEPPAPLNGPRAAPPPFSPSSATNQDRRCVFPPDKSPRILLRQAPVLPPPGLPSPEQLPLAENRWVHAIVNEEMDEGERIGVANMICDRDEAALRNIFLAAPFSLRHEHHYRTQEAHDVAERSRRLGPLRVRFRNHFLPGRGIVRSPDVIRRRRRRPPTPPVCLPAWFFAFSRA